MPVSCVRGAGAPPGASACALCEQHSLTPSDKGLALSVQRLFHSVTLSQSFNYIERSTVAELRLQCKYLTLKIDRPSLENYRWKISEIIVLGC